MDLLKNEEDVRAKVVMPWLQSLGFDESEVSLEETFSIRLGHNVFKVGGERKQRAGGRADVLVQRHGQNLFVVEVKAHGIPLNEDARDQGVSYARLVHPPAPFVVLTNGADWKFFNTVTKEELVESPRSDSSFEFSLNDEARNEALSYFYGFSQANILQFLRGLTDYEFQSLRAGKYKEEFYVSRSGADQTLRSFIESESKVLLISARSGMGKSSWMCHSVETLNIPCVYLRAPNIKDGVFSQICREAGWVFTAQGNTQTTFKKLMCGIKDKPLVVFLDDMDLIPLGDAREIVEEFFRDSHHLTNPPKLVLAGSASRLKELRMFHAEPTSLDRGNRVDLDLNQLSAMEFKETINQHRRRFNFWGQIDAMSENRFKDDLFLMHVAMEVAVRFNLGSVSKDLKLVLSRFLELRLTSFPNPQATKRFLSNVATKMLETGTDTLVFDGNEEHLRLVREACILVEDDRGRVTFHEQLLQDYIAAFVARCWDEKTATQLDTELKRWPDEEPKRRAINLFVEYANDEQLGVIAPRCLAVGLAARNEFLGVVERFSDEYRRALPPHSTQVTMYVYADVDADEVAAVGYCAAHDSRKVLCVSHKKSNAWQAIANHGVAYLTFQQNLGIEAAKKNARNSVITGSQYAFQRGLIHGSTSEMLTEWLLSVFLTEFKHFVLDLDPYKQGNRSLDLDRAFEVLEIGAIFEARCKASDEVEYLEGGDGMVYQKSFRKGLEVAEKARLFDEAVADYNAGERENFPPQFRTFEEGLEVLKEKGVTSLAWPVFEPGYGDGAYWQNWSFGALAAMMCKLYNHAILGYRSLVQANFPELVDWFPLSNLNLSVLIGFRSADSTHGPRWAQNFPKPVRLTVWMYDAGRPGLEVEIATAPPEISDEHLIIDDQKFVLVRKYDRAVTSYFDGMNQAFHGAHAKLTPLVYLAHQLLWEDFELYLKSRVGNSAEVTRGS